MNQRRLSPTDLQSVAFDHSAILPRKGLHNTAHEKIFYIIFRFCQETERLRLDEQEYHVAGVF